MRTSIMAGLIGLSLAAEATARSRATECYVELRGPSISSEGTHRQVAAADGSCTFGVQVCLNTARDGCEPAAMERVAVRARPRSLALDVPDPGGMDACGETTSIVVEGGRRAIVRAKARAMDGRSDRDKIVLRCLGDEDRFPPPQGDWCEERSEELAGALGRLVDFPPSIPLADNCAYSSNYATPVELLDPDAQEELHVVTLFEGALPPGVVPGPGQTLRGTVRVRVRLRPKPVVLFLGSLFPVSWDLTLEEGAEISRVIVQGPGGTEILGLDANVPVVPRAPEEACGFTTGWELGQGGGASYLLMIEDVRRLTGLRETSFLGCGVTDALVVPYFVGDPPVVPRLHADGDESIARLDVPFPSCAAVAAESAYCLTMAEEGPALLGLDTGRVCDLPAVAPTLESGAPSSIGWRGEILYTCLDGEVLRISLRDGSWEPSQVPCHAVTDDGSRILMAPDWYTAVHAYPTFTDLLNGTPARSYEPASAFTMTATPERILAEGLRSGEVATLNLRTGRAGRPIPLQGYDGWILGLSETGDGGLAVAGDEWGDTVRIHDASTGARLCDLHPERPVGGLACVSRRSAPITCALDPTTTTVTTTTTTTTIPDGCSPREVACCHGTEPGGPCWEIYRNLSPDIFFSPRAMCTSILSEGGCPATCAPAATCLSQRGCPVVALPETFGLPLDLLCSSGFVPGCEIHVGSCPADPTFGLSTND